MDILFWSGGKDAYLALQFCRKQYPDQEVWLLTTFEEAADIVPHQNIAISHIRKQAASLGLELIRVPLPTDCPNDIYLERVEEALLEVDESIDHLIFGDWHLQDIRDWREQVFGDMGYDCLFPIWKQSIHDLLPILQLKPVDIEISAVKEEYQPLLKIGEPFDQALIIQLQQLPDIDPMGENGEFHTKVIFRDLDERVE